MKVQSKKDYYTVKCDNQTQTADVLNFIQGNDERDWFHWIYVSKCEEGDDINNSIPERLSYLPVISFEYWQSLPDFPKPEYNPKDVAFNQRTMIGYKFKNKYLLETFKSIYDGFVPWCDTFDLLPDNILKKKLENLGVIELWFNPVYEPITLKSGVKLSEDDIAEVKEILNNK